MSLKTVSNLLILLDWSCRRTRRRRIDPAFYSCTVQRIGIFVLKI